MIPLSRRAALLPAFLVSCCFAGPAFAQAVVHLNGGLPGLSMVDGAYTPSPLVPPCGIVPLGCPAPFPLPPGVLPPFAGGEAYDEATNTLYLSDGALIQTQFGAFGGCVVGPIFPVLAWPPGPCGPIAGPAAPIVAMSDSAAAGAIWVLNAAGLASLIPVPPGPVLAQVAAPPAVIVAAPSGISFAPATGLLWLQGALGPAVAIPAPPPGAFLCVPPPPFLVLLPPACVPPPIVGIAAGSASPAGVAPIWVTNGFVTGDITTGVCLCAPPPPPGTAATDLEFADLPSSYGPYCGACGPQLRTAGGLPVIGNGGFALEIANGSAQPGASALVLCSTGPAAATITGGCTLLVDPTLLVFISPPLPYGPGPGLGCVWGSTLPLPLPFAPGIVGLQLFFQGAVVPTTDPSGFALTPGLRITLGYP